MADATLAEAALGSVEAVAPLEEAAEDSVDLAVAPSEEAVPVDHGSKRIEQICWRI